MTQETSAQNIKNQHKSRIGNEKIEELKRNPMYGKFHPELERPSVDKEKPLAWLSSSGSEEMESLITAVEDQALNIIKLPIDSKCRMCYKAEENIKWIVPGGTTLAPSEYTKATIRWLVTSTG
jgi:hypothetical protein